MLGGSKHTVTLLHIFRASGPPQPPRIYAPGSDVLAVKLAQYTFLSVRLSVGP